MALVGRVVDDLQHAGTSATAVLGPVVLAMAAVVLATLDVPAPVVGIVVLALVASLAVLDRIRPGPVLGTLALIGLLATALATAMDDQLSVWLVVTTVMVLLAEVVDDPLGTRLAPTVRAVHLPGVAADTRRRPPGPYTLLVRCAVAGLAALLVIDSVVRLPTMVDMAVLVLVTLGLAWCSLRLRRAVVARRNRVADRAVTEALTAYAPEFYVYFSGPPEGDYQVRMWLPYLERLGVRYAVLAREDGMLGRAAALTSVPVLACPRLAGLDACMVPSVRALFYVNTHHQCVDGVRYLDRTHVHLNHGDSDKPSSYHPMIAMFDHVFVAGRAAVDRFSRNGVVVPEQKFVLVGRPQVADISSSNLDPLPGRRTVLYAPTWRGGVRDMSFSSLPRGEQIVQALLDSGVRVVFRPHPYSLRDTVSAAAITRIDAMLADASTPDRPHVTSAGTRGRPITDDYNRSDALMTDVSGTASDYLQSGKPMAVVDLAGTELGEKADVEAYPVLRAAYLLALDGDIVESLRPMLSEDPLATTRRELRTYYLGDHSDSVETFVTAARRALGKPEPAAG